MIEHISLANIEYREPWVTTSQTSDDFEDTVDTDGVTRKIKFCYWASLFLGYQKRVIS